MQSSVVIFGLVGSGQVRIIFRSKMKKKLKKAKELRYQCCTCDKILTKGEIVIDSQFTPQCIYCINENNI